VKPPWDQFLQVVKRKHILSNEGIDLIELALVSLQKFFVGKRMLHVVMFRACLSNL
jgi:hypothetical protein